MVRMCGGGEGWIPTGYGFADENIMVTRPLDGMVLFWVEVTTTIKSDGALLACSHGVILFRDSGRPRSLSRYSRVRVLDRLILFSIKSRALDVQ